MIEPSVHSGPVVVTGATSFIGYHLACRFAADGHPVIATHSRPASDYRGIQKQRLDALPDGVTTAELDIRDDDQTGALLDRFAPTLWVHHAGYATAYGSLDYDLATGFDINVVPLTALYRRLENSSTSVLVTGSSAEYSDSDVADREDDPCWPATPYGLSKLSETLLAHHLSARFNIPTRVARVYIPFGSLDAPTKLLSDVMRALRENQPVDLSACTQKRDFIGISDLVDGFAAMADDLSRGGFDLFNLSSGEATSLRDLVRAIADEMKADHALLKFGARPLRPGEPDVSYGDNAKARRLLDWTPAPLAESIRRDLL